MLGLLVTGHGRFATGLYSGLEFIAGTHKNVELIDFEDAHSIEHLKACLNQTLDSMKPYDGVLILTDLPGGSPFKQAVQCKLERPEQLIEVVSGTNLPMLVACATMSGVFDTPLELAQTMLPEGKNGMTFYSEQ